MFEQGENAMTGTLKGEYAQGGQISILERVKFYIKDTENQLEKLKKAEALLEKYPDFQELLVLLRNTGI